jgi:DNA helicase II / ATP-dependent DNA helicase PcrA
LITPPSPSRRCTGASSSTTVGPARALFLSFSRAAVAQILDRTADILGPYKDRVEITTYHAFAWSLIERFGSAVGLPEPAMATEAELKLFQPSGAIRYKDMIPLARRLCRVPAIASHVRARWSLIVCDEFQDTDAGQFQLLTEIRGSARLLLLGDPNQCIYSSLPDAVGVGPERLTAALALPGARQVTLPEASHRDPTGVLPAACAVPKAAQGLTCCFTLSARVHPSRLSVHGPGARLADAAGAQ